jgi:hypothetical protein
MLIQVSIFKKILSVAILCCLTSLAESKAISLICIGDEPYYENWTRINKSLNSDTSVVEIDKTAGTITFRLLHIGQVIAPLSQDEQFYSGIADINRVVMGKMVYKVRFDINRITGDSYSTYVLDKKEWSGYMGFDGKCAPGEPRF